MQAKKETISQYVYSFRGGLLILSGISHQNHTDQGLHLKPSRVAGVAAPSYLLHYCLLLDHYWSNVWVKRTDLLFDHLSRPLAGASVELNLENLSQGLYERICKHTINMPVTESRTTSKD